MGQAVAMAITLPLPVRLAAGILGAGIDLLRALPEDIPAIPVTIVGNAMRLSLKVQQEIASLATRGDELLSGVIGAPQENPTWAKFDDDEPATPVTPIRPAGRTRPAGGSGSTRTPAPVAPEPHIEEPSDTAEPDALASTPAPTDTAAEPAADDEPALVTPETTAMPPVTTTAMDAAIDVPQSVIDSATVAVPDVVEPDVLPAEVILAEAIVADAEVPDAELTDAALADTGMPDTEATEADLINDEILVELAIDAARESTGQLDSDKDDSDMDESDEELSITLPSELADDPNEPVIIGETEELTEGLPIPEELIEEVAAAAETDGPTVLPDYDRMTLAQVRGHLRDLSSADVSELLRYEQDGDNRAPFLTLLSNRLVTLDAQHS
jgi:hypothetical protein